MLNCTNFIHTWLTVTLSCFGHYNRFSLLTYLLQMQH